MTKIKSYFPFLRHYQYLNQNTYRLGKGIFDFFWRNKLYISIFIVMNLDFQNSSDFCLASLFSNGPDRSPTSIPTKVLKTKICIMIFFGIIISSNCLGRSHCVLDWDLPEILWLKLVIFYTQHNCFSVLIVYRKGTAYPMFIVV